MNPDPDWNHIPEENVEVNFNTPLCRLAQKRKTFFREEETNEEKISNF